MIWGAGPAVAVPTATDSLLGSKKWSAGPSVVVLVSEGPLVAGGLFRHIWSFAGDRDRASVNQTLIQPFVNYNLPGGFYLVTAPIITGNWSAGSGDRWVVPVGGGGGKILRLGKLPVNVSVQAYYNAVKPDLGADWSLRLQFQLLFPK
ncbi:hypothetical protein [Mucisphaera calidilacus]|uniref:hypothetical protein n=1 Tax=Mucisphaera calidilacus TaxID=2527982 RepID=UPI001F2D62CB|nr:hypothetical protein [Mucisphaera calidilacus]